MLKVRSPGTVSVFNCGVIQFGMEEGDKYAIVMELMDGSLRELIKLKGKVSLKEAIGYIFQVVCSYKFLEEKKILHRDIKPENILFNEMKNGGYEFKLADFGLSKSAELSNFSNIGTLLYMAPEQRKARK